MVEISRVSLSEVSEYTARLHELVVSTIDLPTEALEKYNTTWSEKTISNSLEELVLVKAVADSAIVGVVLGVKPEAGVGTIIWVLVDGQTQKGGIGSKMLDYAFRQYRNKGAHKVKLTAPAKEIVGFYEKNGMQLEGFFPNHWYNRDFWQLGKTLNT